MSRSTWGIEPLAVMAAFLLSAASARAQDIPVAALHDWQYYNNAAHRALARGDLNQAELRFGAAIEVMRPYEATAMRLLARSYCDLSWVLYKQKRYADAEPLAEWALEVRAHHRGVKPDSIFQSLSVLGMIERARQRYDQAETHLKRALEIQEKGIGPSHLETAATLDTLAGLYHDQGKDAEADPYYRRALAIREKSLPPNHPDLAEILEHYAASLRARNQVDPARLLETRALAIRTAISEKKADPRPVNPPQAPGAFRRGR